MLYLFFFPVLLFADLRYIPDPPPQKTNSSLTLQLSGLLGLQLWSSEFDDFQHQTRGQLGIAFRAGNLVFGCYYGELRWGRHEAVLPGSFINAEANKALEKNHGFFLQTSFKDFFEAGAVYARRALILINLPEKWGPPLIKGREFQPDPDFSIGYHDGLRCYFRISGKNWELGASGPIIASLNDRTLPDNDFNLAGKLRLKRFFFEANLHSGGFRDAALDFSAGFDCGQGLNLELRHGSIPFPGWQFRPLKRTALSVNIEIGKKTWRLFTRKAGNK